MPIEVNASDLIDPERVEIASPCRTMVMCGRSACSFSSRNKIASRALSPLRSAAFRLVQRRHCWERHGTAGHGGAGLAFRRGQSPGRAETRHIAAARSAAVTPPATREGIAAARCSAGRPAGESHGTAGRRGAGLAIPAVTLPAPPGSVTSPPHELPPAGSVTAPPATAEPASQSAAVIPPAPRRAGKRHVTAA